jgi:outer membrane protein assembly factor BamA
LKHTTALLILVSAALHSTLAIADEIDLSYQRTYDPWEGIQPNGLIPKIELPADLPNPERWRYIPPGRIKPGNFFERLLVSSFVAPIIFRDADVGWGFGAAVADLDFRKQRRREFIGLTASYSTEGQQRYALIWNRWLNQINLKNGGILQEERNLMTGRAGYSNTLTRRFFGIGPDTDPDDETRYSDEKAVVSLGVERSWPEPGSDLIWKLGMRGEFHQLADGRGSEPNTGDVYPVLFDGSDDTNLGIVDAAIGWDTRDSQVNPYRGWDVSASVSAALFQTDWDVGASWAFGGSYTRPVWGLFHSGGDPGEENPPTDVITLRARIEQVSGDLPFYELPTLGGSEDLRGFIDGRFRDDSLWIAGIEWRFWVIPRGFRIPFTKAVRIERIGLAPFFEAGTVAANVGDFGGAKVHLSYGVSLLVAIERVAPFRINLGWSNEDFNLSAGFGLDF